MEQERTESMLSRNIDGLILTERTHTPRTAKMIESRRDSGGGTDGQPVAVCLDIAVGFDNFEAARQMTAAIVSRVVIVISPIWGRAPRRTYYHRSRRRTGDAGRRHGSPTV